MNINKAWCFFEQSGVFKNECKTLGIPADDYDILNNFNQTDYQIDLFDEIEQAFTGKASIFQHISTNVFDRIKKHWDKQRRYIGVIK